MQWVVRFLQSLAIPVDPPAAYGLLHLLFFFIGVIVCVLVSSRFRTAEEKVNKHVLLTVGFVLLFLELFKQAFQYWGVGYETYPFGIFPFHLCSMPIYLCIIAGFIRSGPLQRALQNYLGTFGFLGGFVAFFEPSGLLHNYYAATFHSLTWHMLLVFLGVYHFFSGRVTQQKGSFRQAVWIFLLLSVLAFGINNLFYQASGGTINMFFIGPAHSSIIVFRDISKQAGWPISTLLFLQCVIGAAWITYRIHQLRPRILRETPV